MYLTPLLPLAHLLIPVPWPPTPMDPKWSRSLGPPVLSFCSPAAFSWVSARTSRAYQGGIPAAAMADNEQSRNPRREREFRLSVMVGLQAVCGLVWR